MAMKLTLLSPFGQKCVTRFCPTTAGMFPRRYYGGQRLNVMDFVFTRFGKRSEEHTGEKPEDEHWEEKARDIHTGEKPYNHTGEMTEKGGKDKMGNDSKSAGNN